MARPRKTEPDRTRAGPAESASEEPGFEKALARLEEIVGLLESGEASLEASLALFEEGIGLSRRCNRRLEAVERRLEMLVQRADGTHITAPFTEKGVPPEDPDSPENGG